MQIFSETFSNNNALYVILRSGNDEESYYKICIRKFCFEFLFIKGLCPLKSHKGLPPLDPAHFFEKKWTKNFYGSLRSDCLSAVVLNKNRTSGFISLLCDKSKNIAE